MFQMGVHMHKCRLGLPSALTTSRARLQFYTHAHTQSTGPPSPLFLRALNKSETSHVEPLRISSLVLKKPRGDKNMKEEEKKKGAVGKPDSPVELELRLGHVCSSKGSTGTAQLHQVAGEESIFQGEYARRSRRIDTLYPI